MSNLLLPGRFSIGLTGGIGSGKTLVADMFAERCAAIIDTDQIAHRLTAPDGAAIPLIRTRFGDDFITDAGAMDRTKMREKVFNDANSKRQLEAILHPLIRIETERAAAHAQGIYLIFAVPLLVESGSWKSRVSRVLVVDCPEQLQISRVAARNRLSEAQIRAIMATQATRSARLAVADDVIINDKDIAALVPQIDHLHALYCALAKVT